MIHWTRPSRFGVSIRIAAWSTDSSKGKYGNPVPSIGYPKTSVHQCHLSPSFLSWSLPLVEVTQVTSFVSLHSWTWKVCNSLSTQPSGPHSVTFQSSSILFCHNFLNSSALSFLISLMDCRIGLQWYSFIPVFFGSLTFWM